MREYKANKSGAIVQLVVWSIVLLILASSFLLSIAGTFLDFTRGGFSIIDGEYYADADEYIVGNVEYNGRIDELDIYWTAGEVEILLYDGDEIKVEESGAGSNEREHMRTRLEDGKLEIRFAASGTKLFSSEISKELKVYLPTLANEWGIELEIYSESSDVIIGKSAKALCFDDAEISNVSGNTELYCYADSIEINTTSGSMSVNGNVCDMTTASISGRLDYMGELERAHISTVSGDVNIRTSADVPDELQIDSVSGNVELSIPDTASGFDAELDSISGNMRCGNSSGDSYEHRGGRASYMFDTVSLNVLIEING